jgi:VanZ family protein
MKSFVPAYLLSLFIWIMASLPGEDLEKIQRFSQSPWLRFFLSDAFAHVLVFGLLTLLIFKGFYDKGEKPIPFIKIGLIAFGYGLSIEIYQAILPWRSFGLDDLIWNTIGVLFFLGLSHRLARLKVTPIGESR